MPKPSLCRLVLLICCVLMINAVNGANLAAQESIEDDLQLIDLRHGGVNFRGGSNELLFEVLDVSDEQQAKMLAAVKKIEANIEMDFDEIQKRIDLAEKSSGNGSELTPEQKIARSMRLEEAALEMQTLRAREQKETIDVMLDALLPHQKKELVGFFLWRKANSEQGIRLVLDQKLVRKKLEITGKQSTEIVTEAMRLQKDFEAELEKLKSKYRDRLKREVFEKDQRKDVDKLIGENPGLKTKMPIRF